MQRTVPPPSVSIVGMAVATIGPLRSSAARCDPESDSSARFDIAMTFSPRAERSSIMLPARVRELLEAQVDHFVLARAQRIDDTLALVLHVCKRSRSQRTESLTHITTFV